MEWTVSEFDEPRRLGFTGAGPAGSEAAMSYVLAEADGGDTTRVEYETSYELPGGPLGAVAGKVLEPRSDDEADDTLGNLKRVVESG
jgi:uncharacterized membrane protein